MRCRKAEKQLALMAGGDLPEKQAAGLMAHLQSCRSCAGELARLQHSRELLSKVVDADKPDPLPEDFSRRVLLDIVDGAVKRDIAGKRHLWKPAMAFAAAALVIFLAVNATQNLLESRQGFKAFKGNSSRQVTAVNPGEIEWGAKYAFVKNLIGPSPLKTLELPEQPGIFAILHKPDPQNRPKVFAVNVIGESSELASLKENLVTIGKAEVMISREDSGDNLYIVLYPMPESSAEERRMLKETLIDKYRPQTSGNGGI